MQLEYTENLPQWPVGKSLYKKSSEKDIIWKLKKPLKIVWYKDSSQSNLTKVIIKGKEFFHNCSADLSHNLLLGWSLNQLLISKNLANISDRKFQTGNV